MLAITSEETKQFKSLAMWQAKSYHFPVQKKERVNGKYAVLHELANDQQLKSFSFLLLF